MKVEINVPDSLSEIRLEQYHLIDAARYAISYQLKNPNYGSYAVR